MFYYFTTCFIHIKLLSVKKFYFADREERDQERNLTAVNIVTNHSPGHFLFSIISECIQERNRTAAHSVRSHLHNWAPYNVIRKSTPERNRTAAHSARNHLHNRAPYNAIRKSTLERNPSHYVTIAGSAPSVIIAQSPLLVYRVLNYTWQHIFVWNHTAAPFVINRIILKIKWTIIWSYIQGKIPINVPSAQELFEELEH